MADFQLDARPYFQVLHNLLRQDGLDYDEDLTADTVEWVRSNSSLLRKITTTAEWGVVTAFYAHWDAHRVAPDRKMIGELVHAKQKCEPMLDVLSGYDHHAGDLEVVPALNLDMYMDQRKEDYEKAKLAKTLNNALDIAIGSVQMNDKAKTVYTGPRDAMKYLHQRMQEGILMGDRPTIGGDTATVGCRDVARRIDLAATRPGNIIRTLTPMDRSFRIGPDQGIRFVGVLGSTNHGKSAMLFQLAYTAALAQYRVLFVPRECSVSDAWQRFVWLHAATIGLIDRLPPIDKATEYGHATAEHVAAIQVIESDMIARGFQIDIRSASDWPSIQRSVEVVQNHDPYDMLVVDYIAHLHTMGRNEKDEMKEIYRSAQALSQDYADGRGLVVLTALQANKAGEEEAAEGDVLARGIYTHVGAIYEHTFAAHDLDALVGVWSGDGVKEHGLSRISCIKARAKHFQPFWMRRDPRSLGLAFISDRETAERVTRGYVSSPETKPQPMSQELTDMEALLV
jgi:hypothetical protein